MNWDWVISLLIIMGLVLTAWAKVSQQTIKELLKDLIELVKEQKEEGEETLSYYG